MPHPPPASLYWLLSRPLGGQACLVNGGTQMPQPILQEVWAGRGQTLCIDVVATHLASPRMVLGFTCCPGVVIPCVLFHPQSVLIWTITDMTPQWTPLPCLLRIDLTKSSSGHSSSGRVCFQKDSCSSQKSEGREAVLTLEMPSVFNPGGEGSGVPTTQESLRTQMGAGLEYSSHLENCRGRAVPTVTVRSLGAARTC